MECVSNTIIGMVRKDFKSPLLYQFDFKVSPKIKWNFMLCLSEIVDENQLRNLMTYSIL